MTTTHRLRHLSRYHYDETVVEEHAELRLRPADDARQHVVSFSLTVVPGGRQRTFQDYWGTHVTTVGIPGPHDRTVLTAESVVEVQPTAELGRGPTDEDGREELRLHHAELVTADGLAEVTDEITAAATEVAGDTLGAGTLAVGAALAAHVHETIRYAPAESDPGDTAADTLARGAGAGMDLAHLTVAMCRALGVPARYVGGYLVDGHARRPTTCSHAWAEVAIGNGRFAAVDPTTGAAVGDRHIVIGRGRDYRDVAPVHGAYLGDPATAVEVVITSD